MGPRGMRRQPQFTHISEDDFRIVRDNLAGGNRSTRDRLVPYCMFTDPPLAHVGLSEGEAERRGIIARVARLPMNSVLGAQATDQRQGFMKALVGENHDRILGFTMIGATAGEVMAAVQTAMIAELPYSRLANAALAHPTMAEGLEHAFLKHTASVGSTDQARKSRIGSRIRVLTRTPCSVPVENNVIVQAAGGVAAAHPLIANKCVR